MGSPSTSSTQGQARCLLWYKSRGSEGFYAWEADLRFSTRGYSRTLHSNCPLDLQDTTSPRTESRILQLYMTLNIMLKQALQGIDSIEIQSRPGQEQFREPLAW